MASMIRLEMKDRCAKFWQNMLDTKSFLKDLRFGNGLEASRLLLSLASHKYEENAGTFIDFRSPSSIQSLAIHHRDNPRLTELCVRFHLGENIEVRVKEMCLLRNIALVYKLFHLVARLDHYVTQTYQYHHKRDENDNNAIKVELRCEDTYGAHLFEILGHFQAQDKMTDFDFQFHDQGHIRVHRVILNLFCPKFFAANNITNVFRFATYSPEFFQGAQAVVDLLYGRNVEVPRNCWHGVKQFADSLDLEDLCVIANFHCLPGCEVCPKLAPMSPKAEVKQEVPERSESPEMPELPGIVDLPERSESLEMPELPEIVDLPERSESPEMPELPEIVDLPESAESSEMLEWPEMIELSDIQEIEDILNLLEPDTPMDPNGPFAGIN